jgi:hypothetical protein
MDAVICAAGRNTGTREILKERMIFNFLADRRFIHAQGIGNGFTGRVVIQTFFNNDTI